MELGGDARRRSKIDPGTAAGLPMFNDAMFDEQRSTILKINTNAVADVYASPKCANRQVAQSHDDSGTIDYYIPSGGRNTGAINRYGLGDCNGKEKERTISESVQTADDTSGSRRFDCVSHGWARGRQCACCT